MDAKSIGKKIFELRRIQGMTQKELAGKIHVTNKAVSRWENGYNFPDPAIMDDLAQALGVTVHELIEGKSDIKEPSKILVYLLIFLAVSEFALLYIGAYFGMPGNVTFVRITLFAIQMVIAVLSVFMMFSYHDYLFHTKGGEKTATLISMIFLLMWNIDFRIYFIEGLMYCCQMVYSLLIILFLGQSSPYLVPRRKPWVSAILVIAIIALLSLINLFSGEPLLYELGPIITYEY